jgi:hypothetical protein
MRCPNGSRKNRDGLCVCKKDWSMIKGVCVPNVETSHARCPTNSKKIRGICVCNKSYEKIRGFCVPKGSNRSNRYNRSKRIESAKKIQSAFRKSKHTLRSEYLKYHCPESGECLILGKNRKEILQLFNGFKNFDYSDKILTRIGAPSLNGVVHEVRFKHRNYVSYAILKTSKTTTSDNLVYEYLMGLFLNKINNFLPTFLETYSIFQCTPEFHKKLNETVRVEPGDIVPLNLGNRKLLKMGCLKPQYNQIMIQHVKNAESLVVKLKDREFLKNDLTNVLFQVYAALYYLRGRFTHFDLHANNILLQRPFKGVMEFHYGDTVFHSPYVVKIIDYGRAECKYTPTILNELCIIPECSPGCGKSQGFKPYQKTIDETTDVQLLQKIGVFIPKVLKYEFPAEIATIFNVQTLTECYDAFLKVIKPDNNPKVFGILKIDPDLKKKYSFIKLNPK